jgi:hypothetical protein
MIEKLTIEKCPCGNPACNTYGVQQGMFYQGSGFDKDEAEEIACRFNAHKDMLEALEQIAAGTKDMIPPFRAISREMMQRIARDAIAKAKGFDRPVADQPYYPLYLRILRYERIRRIYDTSGR